VNMRIWTGSFEACGERGLACRTFMLKQNLLAVLNISNVQTLNLLLLLFVVRLVIKLMKM
jgi:hypothetical protein